MSPPLRYTIGMAHGLCPGWVGYLLTNPLRRLLQSPAAIVAPYLVPGMTVLEPGPGMGFFTLAMARRIGAQGRIIAVDMQEIMLAGLRRRARRAGLADRIETRLSHAGHLGIEDLAGRVDFALAFAMLHEVEKPALVLAEISRALRPGGRLLLAEPKVHVPASEFEQLLAPAVRAGLVLESRPHIRCCRAAVFLK